MTTLFNFPQLRRTFTDVLEDELYHLPAKQGSLHHMNKSIEDLIADADMRSQTPVHNTSTSLNLHDQQQPRNNIYTEYADPNLTTSAYTQHFEFDMPHQIRIQDQFEPYFEDYEEKEKLLMWPLHSPNMIPVDIMDEVLSDFDEEIDEDDGDMLPDVMDFEMADNGMSQSSFFEDDLYTKTENVPVLSSPVTPAHVEPVSETVEAEATVESPQQEVEVADASETEEGMHFCNLINPTTKQRCQKQFSRPYDLIRHQETIHAPKKKIFRCVVCIEEAGKDGFNKTFSRHDALSRHIRIKHDLSGEDVARAVQYAKDNVEYV